MRCRAPLAVAPTFEDLDEHLDAPIIRQHFRKDPGLPPQACRIPLADAGVSDLNLGACSTGPSSRQNHHVSGDHGSELSDLDVRVRALESVLVEKGYVDPATLDALIETYETRVGPHNGARVVATAWTDPAFRSWLLADATAAIGSLGFQGRQGEHMVALENTPDVHNLAVCTLCSCYPWPVLGLPPVWYKSAPYRSRAVSDPRGVLADFQVDLPTDVEVRVWDSTAEVRYLVVPQRPAGTDGWSVDQLAALVTRDSMIGTGLPRSPHGASG